MDLYNWWNLLEYDKKRAYKCILIIFMILISYIILPLISNIWSLYTGFFQPSIQLVLTILFALILIGSIIIIYFIKPYSNKRLPLILISHVISFLSFIFFWRVIIIQISHLSIIINDLILIALYFPILILIMLRSIGKIWIDKIDFKIKAIVLKTIDNNEKGTSQWKIKNQISKNNLILLDTEYKELILEKIPEILKDLRKENFIKRFKTLHLTKKGRDLINYYFRHISQNGDDTDEISQEEKNLNDRIDNKKMEVPNILDKFLKLNRISSKRDTSGLTLDPTLCRDRGNRKDIFHPKFEVGENAIVLCKTHSQYEALITGRLYLDNICRSCIHYKKNDCFFPRGVVEIVEWEIWSSYSIFPLFDKSKYKCGICGRRIEYVSNILYKFYMKEFKNIEIVQLCCKCNNALKKGENYWILPSIAMPLLLLINLEVAVCILNMMINHPFNLLVFLIFVSIPLIPGIIVIGIRLKRAFAREKLIKKLKM